MADLERACPVCKRCGPRRFCTTGEVDFVRCGFCATLYQAAEPDWARIEQIYKDDYHKKRGHSDDDTIEASKRATTAVYLGMLSRLKVPGRRLLDVGCSTGAGLAAAADGGWEVTGVEFSESAAEQARLRPGVKAVYSGRLADAPLSEESFDVITLFDVIEHIDPVDEILAVIRRLLCPGGLLLILTPDGASVSARLMKARWPHLFDEHVILFSRQGMRIALERAGFGVERTGFALKRVNLDMMVRHVNIHKHLFFGGPLRMLGRVLPGFLLQRMFPFNIGEFYMIARRGCLFDYGFAQFGFAGISGPLMQLSKMSKSLISTSSSPSRSAFSQPVAGGPSVWPVIQACRWPKSS